ncbi:MAG: ATP-dependent RNA helicase HrpA, partial [Gemmatimonadota bacterium]
MSEALSQTEFARRLDALRDQLPACMLLDAARLGERLGRLRQAARRQRPSSLRRDLEQVAAQVERSQRLCRERDALRPAVSYPAELPITRYRGQIVEALRRHPVLIVAGDTGSGKTTQLPKMCLEAGRGQRARIACTQPRRVAALSLSRRLAEELGVPWGRQVGCKIRFRDRTAPETHVKMVTDGVLLAEVRSDPDLMEYDTVILDEAHERSLNIDFLLGYLRLLIRRRPDLRVIVTSATIDTEAFSRAFDGAPVIQVSGRMFPVEVRYWSLPELLGEGEDFSYTEGAAAAVERLLDESPRQPGDVLVFMPSERDIRETRDLLEARLLEGTGRRPTGGRGGVEVLPLFGRLSAADQERVFAPHTGRRVVVATNIAETSLTLPGIRYVVDTGLARISRYNPRTQTQRLPIEEISRSSAEQRQGRAGRVQEGVCVRLCTEAEHLARPEYTQPEIQRANLAEVILRMLDLRLGEVEGFPFIDPPSAAAIRGGYQLLDELGALDGERHLTRLGHDMARMNIAPRVARMILQAHAEGALPEVLAIAAGISVQDPRERPADKRDEADAMHRQFVHPESDFLTLLNIWNAYHDRLEELKTQSQMRRFCRTHFLSFNRMREWRDIHAQLTGILAEMGGFRLEAGAPGHVGTYDAVHRAILAGLLSNVAQTKEHNLYRSTHGREVMLFPGSGLFQRQAPRRRAAAGSAAEPEAGDRPGRAPAWIMAAEMVETSRLFARTAARLRAPWLLELGAYLCRFSYRDPSWSRTAGRVLVTETVRLHGLVVASRAVGYGRINPKAATEIFIREALVNDEIDAPFAFLEHNRQLRHRIETWQTRRRSREGVDLDAAVYAFYHHRLAEVAAVADLHRVIRQHPDGEAFLQMAEADLLGAAALDVDRDAFPDHLVVDGEAVPLAYAYRPGEAEDGVTVKLPYRLIDAVDPAVLDWLVPGLREEKVTALLRSLPKRLRKPLVPVPETARQIARQLAPTHPTFLESLEEHLRAHYGLAVRRADWRPEDLPEHLRLRVEVQGADGQPVGAGRDLRVLSRALEQPAAAADGSGDGAWSRAAAQWERDGIKAWDFGDLPERLEVSDVSGVPVLAVPGLVADGEKSVAIRLFRSRAQAEAASRAGFRRLGELVLHDAVRWLKRDLGPVDQLGLLCHGLGGAALVREEGLEHLLDYLFRCEAVLPLTRATFDAALQQARGRLPDLAPRFLGLLRPVLEQHRELLACPQPYPGLEEDVERLVPAGFLRRVPFERLADLARHLKAAAVRAARWRLGPARDQDKARQVAPYAAALQRLEAAPAEAGPRRAARLDELRWLVEEWRVSVFAQELGTAQPVSPKR